MEKEIPTLPFNSSQGMIMLAASIYSVALSFIVQEYVSSPAVNSLVNNISVAVSVAFALAIGSFVDQHGAWRILFSTTLLSGIACLLPPLIFDLDKAAFIGVLIVVDIVISVISEFDNAARTVYIVRKENREAIPLVQAGDQLAELYRLNCRLSAGFRDPQLRGFAQLPLPLRRPLPVGPLNLAAGAG